MSYSIVRYTPLITKGYITRRIAIEHAIPLVTDIKCAKLLVKVCDEHLMGTHEMGTHEMRTQQDTFYFHGACNMTFPSFPPALLSQALDRLSCQAPPLKTYMDCISSHRTLRLPGLIDTHVHVREPGGWGW